MRAVDDLLSNYQHVIDDLTLVTGTAGVFDVEATPAEGGSTTLLYSKKATGRHAEPGEVLAAFAEHVGPDVPRYGD